MNTKKIFNVLGIILIPTVLVVVLLSNQTNLFKGELSYNIGTPTEIEYLNSDGSAFNLEATITNIQANSLFLTTSTASTAVCRYELNTTNKKNIFSNDNTLKSPSSIKIDISSLKAGNHTLDLVCELSERQGYISLPFTIKSDTNNQTNSKASAPEVTIFEPSRKEVEEPDVKILVGTDISSVCKASLDDLDFDDSDSDNLEMDEINRDNTRFELEIDNLDDGNNTIYVKCANEDDLTKIGESDVLFSVDEDAENDELECSIDLEDDQFDPSKEDIEITYSITENENIGNIDYEIFVATENDTRIDDIKDDSNEDIEDLLGLTYEWDGEIDSQQLVNGDYKFVLYAEDASDSKVNCTSEVDFQLDNSDFDDILIQINTINTSFEPGRSAIDIQLITRVDADRLVLNVYETGNAAPIKTIFYQCDTNEDCPTRTGEVKDGALALKWDGTDRTGRLVTPGNYFFKASLKDDDDNIYVAFSNTVSANGYIGNNPGYIGNNPGYPGYPGYPGGPTPTPGTCNFIDIQPNDPDYAAVQWVCNNGIFTGSNGLMNPNQPLLRVDFIAVANRIAACYPTVYNPQIDGNLGFIDLNQHMNDPAKYWFLAEIKNASRDCVSRGQTISGYPDGTIQIDRPILASEMWKVVVEAAKNGNRANYNFTANPNQNPWYIDYQALLQTNGVPLNVPEQTMTRRDAIKLLHNMYLRGLIK